ncbi:MAG: HD domain-containing protein [Phycisphaerales bacterium]|nr:HD domain-containing protein [Phycisphaerales bacterium]
MGKSKKFRDPVHGYIAIPEDFCAYIIDTPVFQRLREIEQTGMRVLYPGARHCRFSHSLGTYHLGTRAFRHFRENAKASFENVSPGQWDSYGKTFSIACLLHDCAHAPFSHTFEHYYDYVNGPVLSRLESPLLAAADDKDFQNDFTDPTASKPSAHEKASAILLLTYFSKPVSRLDGNPLLAARMILGCKHLDPKSNNQKLENCLISFLNGSVDVDKLDYILRDTWASGVDNVSIDIDRLLSSISYDPAKKRAVFRKSALSVLQSVVDGRNYLYRWIFAHHKIVYNQYLIKTAVKKLASLISPENSDLFLSNFFSCDALVKDVDIGGGISVHLPTDQDLTVLLKNHRKDIPEAEEYLFRTHRCKPLWKTSVEFSRLFREHSSPQLDYIVAHAKDALAAMLGKTPEDSGIIVEPIPEKTVSIRTGDIFIQLDKESHSYNHILDVKNSSEPKNAFYVFVPNAVIERKQELIEKLQTMGPS